NNAVNPHAAQMRYSCINEIIPASAKPSDGPKASARLPDSPKSPIPSPRRLGGIKSVAMVPVAVLENPQPIPWMIRTKNKSTMLVIKPNAPTERTNKNKPNIYKKRRPLDSNELSYNDLCNNADKLN